MITQQDEIENVQEAYDVEKEQLDELQARFDKLKVRKKLSESLWHHKLRSTTIKLSRNDD